MTLGIGYGLSSVLLLGFFLTTLLLQLKSKKYNPVIYWLVIISTSTAGTTISDYMDRTLGLGYAKGSLFLFMCLLTVLLVWWKSEKSLEVSDISTFRPELFYWMAILCSNTLGTALGDYLADDSGLGFAGGAILIGFVLLVVVFLKFFSQVSAILLFWIAFILTRPFGATFGDLLTKPQESGGLNLGTVGSSAVLLSLLFILVVNEQIKSHKGESS
jgi:uncharacterized membrane-anchored protein